MSLRGKLCSKAEANYWGKRERNASETRDSLCYPVLCFVVLVTQNPPPVGHAKYIPVFSLSSMSVFQFLLFHMAFVVCDAATLLLFV